MVNKVPREVPWPKPDCGPSCFGLGTSLGTTFTMIPPRLFHTLSHYTLHTTHYTPKSTVHTYTCIHAASPVYPSLYPGNLLELLGLLLPALAMLLRGKDFLGQLRKVLALGQEKPLGPLLIGSVISGVYKLGQFQ